MPSCLLFYILAVLFFMSSQQWFFMWLMMELSTITFISFYFYSKLQPESITLYFLIQSVASFFILFSLIKTANMNLMMYSPDMILLGGVLMKVGMFPFHNWVPSATMKMKKFMLLTVILIQKIIPFMWLLLFKFPHPHTYLVFSIMNMMLISPQNLMQTEMKMILVLSSMSHSSWLLLSCSSNYMWEIYYSLYILIMFMMFMLMNEKFKNIFQKNNRTPLFLIFLTLGGMPPFMGFYPKFFLIGLMIEAKLFMTLMFVLMLSLVDLLVYGRLSMLATLNKKVSLKWQKMNELTKMFFLMNFLVVSTILI